MATYLWNGGLGHWFHLAFIFAGINAFPLEWLSVPGDPIYAMEDGTARLNWTYQVKGNCDLQIIRWYKSQRPHHSPPIANFLFEDRTFHAIPPYTEDRLSHPEYPDSAVLDIHNVVPEDAGRYSVFVQNCGEKSDANLVVLKRDEVCGGGKTGPFLVTATIDGKDVALETFTTVPRTGEVSAVRIQYRPRNLAEYLSVDVVMKQLLPDGKQILLAECRNTTVCGRGSLKPVQSAPRDVHYISFFVEASVVEVNCTYNEEFNIVITDEPALTDDLPQRKMADVARSLSTRCSFHGYPATTIEWQYNGGNQLPPAVRVRDVGGSGAGLDTVTSELTWTKESCKPLRREASGNYRCVATNIAGRATSTEMHLGTIEWHPVPVTRMYIPEGGKVKLPWRYNLTKGSDLDHLTWYKDSEQMARYDVINKRFMASASYQGRLRMEGNAGLELLDAATPDDSGVYSIRPNTWTPKDENIDIVVVPFDDCCHQQELMTIAVGNRLTNYAVGTSLELSKVKENKSIVIHYQPVRIAEHFTLNVHIREVIDSAAYTVAQCCNVTTCQGYLHQLKASEIRFSTAYIVLSYEVVQTGIKGAISIPLATDSTPNVLVIVLFILLALTVLGAVTVIILYLTRKRRMQRIPSDNKVDMSPLNAPIIQVQRETGKDTLET